MNVRNVILLVLGFGFGANAYALPMCDYNAGDIVISGSVISNVPTCCDLTFYGRFPSTANGTTHKTQYLGCQRTNGTIYNWGPKQFDLYDQYFGTECPAVPSCGNSS